MANPDPLIETLREAVQVSPHNIPLRQHLADSLLQRARYAEAEQEYRQTLALTASEPANLARTLRLQKGLVQALTGQTQTQAALQLLQQLLQDQSDGELLLFHARLLLQSGEKARAIGEYLRALDLDQALVDRQLAAQLGLLPDNEEIFTPSPAAPPVAPPTNQTHGVPASSGIADDVDEWIKLTADGEIAAPEEKAASQEGNFTLERPALNFADVGGMTQVKEEINIKIIQPLIYPKLYQAYGKVAGGGILMYGPPGCGKTHLARATAGEIRAKFIAVGIHDILDMYFGNSEQKLHELFELARRNKPCVLFFDEVDALGASRRDMRQSAGRHLINQFLAELDGVNTSNDGLLILAATNAPWHLDSAFRRPGRFDRILFVPPPDAPARVEILRILLRGKPTQAIEYEKLADKLPDLSGADLKALVDSAIETKLREAMKSGLPAPLTTKDLQQAAKTIKPTTKEWFLTARNYALYANEGGLYDDILTYLGMK